MGIETLIGLAVAGAIGGGISKANGGSFWKGAALGVATGGVGSAVDAATGGHLSGAYANRKKLEAKAAQANQSSVGNLSQQQAAISDDSSEKARQLLISGNPQRLVASSGLSGSTSSGGSARRRLLGA